MEINRDERVAKIQAFSMLALMALVAVTVHFWPRAPAAVVTTTRPFAAAPSTAPAERQPPSRAPRRVSAPGRRPIPRPVVSVEPVTMELPRPSQPISGPETVPLASLPGGLIAMSPAPPTPSGPARSGAVTRAMQTTGKSVAGAFKKTGSAFRRAF